MESTLKTAFEIQANELVFEKQEYVTCISSGFALLYITRDIVGDSL